jgi:hypothetical protein
MAPEQRLREVAMIFARAILRLKKRSPCLVSVDVQPIGAVPEEREKSLKIIEK